MNKKLLCLSACLFLCVALFSLTVDEAVDYALKNSKTLQSAAIDLEIKTRAKDTAWNSLVPSVQVTGTLARSNKVQNPMSPPGGWKEADHWKAVGNIGVSFMFNAALVQEIRAARADFEAGLITWEQTRADTERSIRKLFTVCFCSRKASLYSKKCLRTLKSVQISRKRAIKTASCRNLLFCRRVLPTKTKSRPSLKQSRNLKANSACSLFYSGFRSIPT